MKQDQASCTEPAAIIWVLVYCFKRWNLFSGRACPPLRLNAGAWRYGNGGLVRPLNVDGQWAPFTYAVDHRIMCPMEIDTSNNDGNSSAEAYLARFGLSSFRPGQLDVIEAVLAGRDCLCVMPTGGGKSLCYQLPGVMLDGLTLVVSPLIALMKDQVDQLQVLGLPVSFINSTLSMAEQFDRLDRMARGEFRLVYVVPERFRSQRFLDAVREVGLKLLAIDEAHCISEWGHDFRPDYARLGHFRRMLGRPTTIALTATATDQVRRDIVEQLDLQDPRMLITGFERPNLFYEVKCPRTDRQKADMLLEFLRRTPGSGIIYTSTRKRAEEVAGMVSQQTGRRSAVYHAGMLPDQRHAAQEAFMSGRYEIVAATNAFGMGIDKADVRFVVHYNLPGTLEAYYQEAGRAGRDGEQSHCMLFYAPSDRYIQEFFIESAYPGREHVETVYNYLCSVDDDPIQMTQAEIKEQLSLPIGNDGVGNCEQLLEGAGVLERMVASQNRAALRIDSDLPTLVDLLPKQAKVRRKVLQAVERLVGQRRNELIHFHPRQLATDSDLNSNAIATALRQLNGLESFTYVPPFRGRAIRMIERDKPFDQLEIDFEALQRRKAAEYEKLNRVIRFALGSGCRQREILRYFGEKDAPRCGHCDNCGDRVTKPAGTGESHETGTNAKLIEAIRIALSGVARTQARFPCGKNLIAQMLCGSANAKMDKLGLNQLSTYGLLKYLKQPEVVTLLDGLVALECLRNVEIEPMRPVIELTDFGSEVMRNETELEGDLPVPAHLVRRICGLSAMAKPETELAQMPEPDLELLNTLKEWRREEGSKLGQPLYQILSNATLTELARCRPDSPEALLEVKGIGPAKLERYGDQLLALLAGSEGEPRGLSPRPAQQEETTPEKTTPPDVMSETARGQAPRLADDVDVVRPGHYWTWRLLAAGFSAAECAEIRGLDREAILDHAIRAVDDGRPVQAESCLSTTLISALETLVGPVPPRQIRPLLAQLPGGTQYEEVQLFLKCRRKPSDGEKQGETGS